MNPPCKDCPHLSACQEKVNRDVEYIGTVFKDIVKDCAIIRKFLTLIDLNIEVPNCDAPPEDMIVYCVYQIRAIKKICRFMKVDHKKHMKTLKDEIHKMVDDL